MLVEYSVPSDESKTDLAILEFRKKLEMQWYGFPLSSTPTCPNNDPKTERFIGRYTFNASELLVNVDRQVIVHHGTVPELVKCMGYKLYLARPIIYAHRSLGRIDLSLSQLRAIVEGRVCNWRDLGYLNRPLRPFRHDGKVQTNVFNALALQTHGAVEIRKDFQGVRTYEELAAQGGTDVGSLVFGLRPEFASDSLAPVCINGVAPGEREYNSQCPSLEVWVFVPENCRADVSGLRAYLQLVLQRIQRDVKSLQRSQDVLTEVNLSAVRNPEMPDFAGHRGLS